MNEDTVAAGIASILLLGAIIFIIKVIGLT